MKKETCPSKLQKKLDIGALSAVTGFRECSILFLPMPSKMYSFDISDLPSATAAYPSPYYYPTTERNPTPASTQIPVPIVQEAESVAELGTLSRGGQKRVRDT